MFAKHVPVKKPLCTKAFPRIEVYVCIILKKTLNLIIFGVFSGEAADDDLALVAVAEVFGEHTLGDAGCLGLGEAIDTGADAGEGDALQAVFLGQTHGGIVTGGEQLALVLVAAIPDGPDGMDDFLTRQTVGIGHLALPRLAAAQRAAFLQQLNTCRPVDGTIYTSAAQQTPVGSIHNRIDLERRDIPYNNLDSFFHIPSD